MGIVTSPSASTGPPTACRLPELEGNIRPKPEFDLVVARALDASLDASMPPTEPTMAFTVLRLRGTE